MSDYQSNHKIKNMSMDNLRRVMNSFYNFLEEEDYIMKSPMKKIHKIKEEKIIKNPFTEDEVVLIQDACKNIREIALIDFLYITGVRVSELCQLNKEDIDFDKQEGIVFGKGAKERLIYFDARTKIHLLKYLKTRKDDNEALFVTSDAPYTRLTKNGIEYLVRIIGERANVEKCHPHRFRRTLATRMIDRGVPIEQVQNILGHTKIEATLIYAQVNQGNVKMSHSKFA
jgi:site-specific recombinase XerD